MIKLEEVMHYYQMRRGSGHTLAALDGAKNIGKCVYLVATQQEARALELKKNYPNIIPVSIHDEQALRGLDLPLVIDHHALAQLIYDYDRDKQKLIQELHSLKAKKKTA